MKSTKEDILSIAKSKNLTYQQKLYSLANAAERLMDPIKELGYTKDEVAYIENSMICDLNEGYLPYRPRYILPDFSIFISNGCKFLEIKPPNDLDELFDGLLILYSHIPSITSFPVYIGSLDKLINPFLTDNEDDDYKKIKRFLNHIDKTIVDSFCHGNIGPEETKAGFHILNAVIELKNPTPNLTLNYDKELTSDKFAMEAIKSCLIASKPSFSNFVKYKEDVGDHGIASCYNALPSNGGAYTLLRLRLGTIVKQAKSVDHFVDELLIDVSKKMASMMDKRISFIVNESNFFETSFLIDEGFIKKENFTAMFGIVGLADCVNRLLKLEDLEETFGTSIRGDEIAHRILTKLDVFLKIHKGVHVERTNNHYLLHGQVGASITEEDKDNTPAHRIRIGEEPILPLHLKQSSQFHKYFLSGTGDLFAFDQTYLDHLDALLDIIKGSFDEGYRYVTTYLKNSDLIRVTGYLVKKSEVDKVRKENVVLRDTALLADGTDNNANTFNRKTRK